MERIDAVRQEGYALLHHGAIELARVEANGIRIHVERLNRAGQFLEKKIRELKADLTGSKVWKRWQREFGHRANLTSRDQLAVILYKRMGFEVTDWTDGGKPSTDEEALQKIDHPFVGDVLRLQKFEKVLGTYVIGIQRELVGDRLHPVFNLHTARTYRSSSESPNFQNLPVRDKEMSRIIRRAFIPSVGSVMVENDFKGIEVSVSACYHKDPNFISYITTPGKDMHRDMAAQLYMLEPKEVSKEARYGAKNRFVFPQFYGDYYVACARNLWEWASKGKLTTGDGVPVKDHLKECGIRKLGLCDPEHPPVKGTFEYHVKEVEDDFWNNRFQKYGQWRRDWYRVYQDRGYFDMLTGFRVHGNFNRKQAANYPIQGSAFHCLLWSLIRVNRLLRKYHMKSLVVGQIHDSLLGDVRIEELGDYLEIVETVTTVELREHYPWIIVPLEVEYEITPSFEAGGSWFDKHEVKFKSGTFHHPDHPERTTTDPIRFVEALDSKAKS